MIGKTLLRLNCFGQSSRSLIGADERGNQKLPILDVRIVQTERPTYGFDGQPALIQVALCKCDDGMILGGQRWFGWWRNSGQRLERLPGASQFVLRDRQLHGEPVAVRIIAFPCPREISDCLLPMLLIETRLSQVEV